MCTPFYSQQNVGEALDLVHGPSDANDTASKLAYLQTTGSLIIHEFMHTAYIANSPPDPWSEYCLVTPEEVGYLRRDSRRC